jgi:signal peptidase II
MLQIRKNRIFAIFIGVMFVALDQWVKLLALETLQSQSFRFGGSFAWLDIVLSFNPGAFLSLGAGFNQVRFEYKLSYQFSVFASLCFLS